MKAEKTPMNESRALKLSEAAVPEAGMHKIWPSMSLAEAVDIALQNNPDSRAA
ncbi:hypothetical protein GX408_11285 [bacterium]|nr:hypothetical protein [bacterium]